MFLVSRFLFDSNATILPSISPNESHPTRDARPPQQQLSKSQQRKLRRIQEEKERRAQRADVIATLSQHQLGAEHLGLLRSVAARGQKESKKKALQRALRLERAGVQLPSNGMELFKERKTVGHGESEESSSSDSEERSGRITRSTRAVGSHIDAQEPAGPDVQSSDEEGSPREHKRAKITCSPQKKEAVHQTVQELDHVRLRAAVAEAKAEIELETGQAGISDDDDQRGVLPARKSMQYGGPASVVLVQRDPALAEARSKLPVVGMEQEIMEAISENDVVVLCGETGSGKTTQVPQFLFEAGYGNAQFPERGGLVAITQPRRVAAISTATRVAEELGNKVGGVVGYQVRHDRQAGPSTALKFMTDGVLLREVQEDFLLSKYSCVIVDEAHERSLNTDILLGLLSRIVQLRRELCANAEPSESRGSNIYPMKLIIMSATLRIEDFVGNSRLFSAPPPVVNVPARQYPVTVHFSRRTEMHDYVGAAYKKVVQIHRNLPPGGVLVFLTGRQEVEHLCGRLTKALAVRKTSQKVQENSINDTEGMEDTEAPGDVWEDGGYDAAEEDVTALDLINDERGAADMSADDYDDDSDNEGEYEDEKEVVTMLGGEGLTPEQIAVAENSLENNQGEDIDDRPVHVLPLYAMLSPDRQERVFRPPPPGNRLIVVATNVAETSLTIPGIRYVVDAGRSKQRLLESNQGGGSSSIARFEVRWVSKASADQRAGRAGRTGPGHCYRLFSSALFNDIFPQHSPPEIVNASLEGVVLALKALGVDKVANFPFPTAPAPEALIAAERCLIALSALDNTTGKLTDMGKSMARYPISPRHARMLLEVRHSTENSAGRDDDQEGKRKTKKMSRAGHQEGFRSNSRQMLLRYAIGLAAAVSVESPFVALDTVGADSAKGDENGNKDPVAEEAQRREREAAREAHARLKIADSDALSALSALCAFEATGLEAEAFCRAHRLHNRNLREAAALRRQLCHIVQAQMKGARATTGEVKNNPLTNTDAFIDPPPSPLPHGALQALRRALAAGWADQVARRVRSLEHVKAAGKGEKARAVRYRSCSMEEDIFLHPNSGSYSICPDLVVYSEIVRTAKRPYMAGVTAIEPRWLAAVAGPLCRFSPPLTEPPPFYSASSDAVLAWYDVTFGKHDWVLPRHAGRHPDPTERAAVFATALLDGRVLPTASELRSAMAAPPSMAARPDMRVHRRVAELIDALVRRGVDCKAALASVWQKEPRYLAAEWRSWVQKGAEGLLDDAWQRLVQEATTVAG